MKLNIIILFLGLSQAFNSTFPEQNLIPKDPESQDPPPELLSKKNPAGGKKKLIYFSQQILELEEIRKQIYEMGLIEIISLILGLYVTVPRFYHFLEVMHISFGFVQKDLIRRYYNYNGESFCLVIGGTSGIGKELALTFGRIGFSIVLIGKNKDKLEDTKQKILQDSKVRVIIIIADLSSNKPELYTEKIFPQLQDLDIAIFVNNCYDCARGFFNDIPLERLHK